MNAIEQLQDLLVKRFPAATITLDRPDTPSASWWLDVVLNTYSVAVEWKPGVGFGVSTPTGDEYGGGPDEVYADPEAAYSRILELLLSQTRTVPDLSLPKLRESRELSQVELAQRLNVNQGALSRLERRSDMLLGTLRNLVGAMGGELKLIAEFPDRTVRIRIDELMGAGGGQRPTSKGAVPRRERKR